MHFPLLQLLLIAAAGGLAYFLVNRAPVIAPTPKAVIKWVIVVVTCYCLFVAITGRAFLRG